jgi:hypothetical protein
VRGRHPDVDNGHIRTMLGDRGRQGGAVADLCHHLVSAALQGLGQAGTQDRRVLGDGDAPAISGSPTKVSDSTVPAASSGMVR